MSFQIVLPHGRCSSWKAPGYPARWLGQSTLHGLPGLKRNRRFYILTRESTGPAFAERARRILKGEDPAQPEGGPVSFARWPNRRPSPIAPPCVVAGGGQEPR